MPLTSDVLAAGQNNSQPFSLQNRKEIIASRARAELSPSYGSGGQDGEEWLHSHGLGAPQVHRGCPRGLLSPGVASPV